jgi:hypothetical protein
MRVVHIVPTAFNYFDDIRNAVFKIVDGLQEKGVSQEIFTLQYSEPEKNNLEEIKKISPKRNYGGARPLAESFEDLASFDLVHFHVPFLGAGKALLMWRQKFKDVPLITSYYRKVLLVDLLSIFISLYNNYFLKKMIPISDMVTTFAGQGDFLHNYARKIALKNKTNFLFQPLTKFDDKVQLNLSDNDLKTAIEFYFELYGCFK